MATRQHHWPGHTLFPIKAVSQVRGKMKLVHLNLPTTEAYPPCICPHRDWPSFRVHLSKHPSEQSLQISSKLVHFLLLRFHTHEARRTEVSVVPPPCWVVRMLTTLLYSQFTFQKLLTFMLLHVVSRVQVLQAQTNPTAPSCPLPASLLNNDDVPPQTNSC